MNNKLNTSIRSQMNDFILDHGPYIYHATFTTSFILSDHRFSSSFNFLIKCINRQLFGHNYNKVGKHLTGFAFAEKQSNQNLHIHLLIAESDLLLELPEPEFRKIVFNQLSRPVVGNSNRPIFQPIGTKVDRIWDNRKLIGYLTWPHHGRSERWCLGCSGTHL